MTDAAWRRDEPWAMCGSKDMAILRDIYEAWKRRPACDDHEFALIAGACRCLLCGAIRATPTPTGEEADDG